MADDPEEFEEIVRGKTRWRQFLDGEITVDDLDDEELRRGQTRGIDGKFHVGPRTVPRALHQQVQRELLRRGYDKFLGHGFEAIDTVAAIMNDASEDSAVRLSAARLVIERVYGKSPERVEVAVGELKPWEQLLPPTAGIFRLLTENEQAAQAAKQLEQ